MPAKKIKNNGRGAVPPPSPCSAVWLDPDTAPKDGTPILGDFGWPWPVYAVWDQYDEQWVVVTVQASPMKDGQINSWFETDTENAGQLKRWTPLPSLPNPEASNHGPK